MKKRKKRNNWDNLWASKLNRFLIKIGLKGNVVLNYALKTEVLKRKPKRESMIELGAGSGKLSALLAKYFKKSLVTDVSWDSLEVSKILIRAPDCSFQRFDILKDQLGEKFDLVLSVCLLDNFSGRNLELALKKHFQLAKKSALVLVVVVSENLARMRREKNRGYLQKYGRLNHRAEVKIKDYLEEKNYRYELFYLEYLSTLRYLGWLYYPNTLLFLLFHLNLDKVIRKIFNPPKGYYAVFFAQNK